VRYLFLTKRQVALCVLGLTTYLLFLAAGLALAPSVVGDYLAAQQHQALSEQRERLGGRLKALVGRLGEIESEAGGSRLEMAKIYLAYGFDYVESEGGEGGYPAPSMQASESIFASEIERGNTLRATIGGQMGVVKSFLSEVQAFEGAHLDLVRTTPSICPLRGKDFVLTSPYGSRTSPFTKRVEFHKGLDLAAPKGTPIFASADGVVAFAGQYDPRASIGWSHYGKLVAIRNGENFVTLYGHCDEIKVRNGQRVRQGDIISTVGDTGWSTSPHLHYEVRRKVAENEFRPVDPRIYILDHRWRDEEKLLVRSRRAPSGEGYEPLPRTLRQ
jgi:murein DD-endopeptidase MepM/ murein hydrolase activator NlpD